MLVPVLLFILGLVLLIKGGDWFVDGSTAIARRFHVPELIIGATVVSIGTTLPGCWFRPPARPAGTAGLPMGTPSAASSATPRWWPP